MKQWLRNFILSFMSYQGEMVYNLLVKYPGDWTLSDNLSKSHLIFRDSKLSLTIGYDFYGFDIADQDSLKELSLLDKLILWPLAKKIRNKLTYKYLEEFK
jgi:hypothetical protein